MRRRLARYMAVLVLVALPMFVGFAGPDVSSGRWDRVAGSAGGVLRELLTTPAAAARDENTVPFEAYKQALDVLKHDYYGPPIDAKKTRDLTYAAIRGMLYTLNDPFTSFLDPDEWTQMQQTTRGDFEGIGAVLEPYGQDVRVVRPIEGSPAYRAGLKPHDVIYSVTNYDHGAKKTTVVLGKNINDVVKLIKGPQGTPVDVAVIRKGHSAPITFHLIRAHIEPPTVRYWMEDPKNKIGRILLNEFNEKSDAQFDKAYQALMAKGMRGLIFDLRYNPGGLLNVAIDIGSRFIDSGPVVIIQEKNGQRQAYGARVRKHHVNVPVVVLINESSASASEIVAGAIKDNKAGILVGTHTFGKGLVQTLFPLSDGSALRLTTAKYFTPKGNDISNKYDEEHRPIFGTGGIKPDVVVTQPDTFTSLDWAEENKKNDAQLKKAIEILRTRLAQNPGRNPQ